jgi:predicted RND superfamily exporter protein
VARIFQLCARHPLLVLVAYALITAVAVYGALQVESEDDVFVFLPEDDPDVELFNDVSARFGSLRVALIGVQLEGEGDLLEAEHLAQIETASTRLSEIPEVTRVTSLTTLTDVVTGPGGAVIEPLVNRIPEDEEQHRALRERVLSRELVVGSLISADAKGAIIMAYVREDVGTTRVVEQIRPIAEQELEGMRLYFAGAPFAADAIYGETRADVKKLSPIAAAVLVLVILLSFRDIVGVLLTFWTVGFGTLVALGAMGFLGSPYTALTSTLPILLLATGSAYAVHVLGRYYLEREHSDPEVALAQSAMIVGKPVAIAAWTTIAAFLAFLVMDVRPMREFGMQVALGTLVCWITAMTLIPAVLTLLPRAPSREQLLPFGDGLLRGFRFARRHRRVFTIGLVLLGGVALLPIPGVRARMDPQAFFREGSEPWQANQYFEEEFGGARFVQVLVEGDLDDPVHLRELARLVDFSRSVPGVSGVQSLVDPLAITTDVLGGGHRLPSTRAQAAQVYVFADGQPELASMLDGGHERALVYLRVKGDAEPVVSALETYISDAFHTDPAPPTADEVAERVAWIGKSLGAEPDLAQLKSITGKAGDPSAFEEQRQRVRREITRRFLASEDASELDDATREAVLAAAGSDDALHAAWLAHVQPADDAEFFHELLQRELEGGRHGFARDALEEQLTAALGLDLADPRVRHPISVAVEDLMADDIEGGDATMRARVTGEPMLDRALARSVQRNQIRTMSLGVVIVFALLVILFGSFITAAACILPAILTALVIGGVMGALDIEIDLSTAMVGAILTDTASDFGMHYLWYLRRSEPEKAVRQVGPIMIVSTLLVALGFFAFALGSSPVLRLFGTLSGATCVVSTLLACVIVPSVWTYLRPKAKKGAKKDAAQST